MPCNKVLLISFLLGGFYTTYSMEIAPKVVGVIHEKPKNEGPNYLQSIRVNGYDVRNDGQTMFIPTIGGQLYITLERQRRQFTQGFIQPKIITLKKNEHIISIDPIKATGQQGRPLPFTNLAESLVYFTKQTNIFSVLLTNNTGMSGLFFNGTHIEPGIAKKILAPQGHIVIEYTQEKNMKRKDFEELQEFYQKQSDQYERQLPKKENGFTRHIAQEVVFRRERIKTGKFEIAPTCFNHPIMPLPPSTKKQFDNTTYLSKLPRELLDPIKKYYICGAVCSNRTPVIASIKIEKEHEKSKMVLEIDDSRFSFDQLEAIKKNS